METKAEEEIARNLAQMKISLQGTPGMGNPFVGCITPCVQPAGCLGSIEC